MDGTIRVTFSDIPFANIASVDLSSGSVYNLYFAPLSTNICAGCPLINPIKVINGLLCLDAAVLLISLIINTLSSGKVDDEDSSIITLLCCLGCGLLVGQSRLK